MIKIGFASPALPKSGALVLFARGKAGLDGLAGEVEEATGGALGRAARAARFAGDKGQVLELAVPAGIAASRVLLVGLGKDKALAPVDLQAIGGKIAARLYAGGDKQAAVALDLAVAGLAPETAAVALATGLALRAWRFDKYRTKEPKSKKPTLARATVMTLAAEEAEAAFAAVRPMIEGVFLTRELTSEPANVLTPKAFANEIEKLAGLGIEVEILGEKEMKKLGMGALLGVGQGSEQDSQLAIMRWQGGAKKAAPLAFVGKGVTFDTGGISIKPAAGMEQMKWDMGGAGIVTGLMKALAGRKAKVNVVGVVGLVENMPSGSAQRPGDVVTSMSGQTIEVINTDAEGRLVLADALWYTKDRFKPRLMIDLATLTGAIITALGHEHAGIFTDEDDLAAALEAAGRATGDKVWRLPLGEAYDRLLDTPTADMKNVGGPAAGSISAAQFLKRFTDGVPWVHVDVAGMVWSEKDGDWFEKGATGFGVRLLDRFVADIGESAEG